MRLLKQAVAVLGTVVLVAMTVALLTPKTAHALVAAMVQVVNTPSQPVPTLAADPLTSFVASNTCPFGDPPDRVRDGCDIVPLYTVPAGKTAVIESASGNCVTNSGTTIREFQLQLTGPNGAAQFSFPSSPAVAGNGDSTGGVAFAVTTTAQDFKSYASAGTPINFFGYASANQQLFSNAQSPGCTFSVSGHLF